MEGYIQLEHLQIIVRAVGDDKSVGVDCGMGEGLMVGCKEGCLTDVWGSLSYFDVASTSDS